MDRFKTTFTALIDGHLSEAEGVRFLSAPLDDEITTRLVSAATLLKAKAVAAGPFPDAIDLCGTGGDAMGTVNISTASALITAACGVKVAKHGNHAASSRSGATDVLQALGITVATTPEEAESQFHAFGITFLSARDFHPALAALAPLRRRLGKRTIFNLLGPLLNPANVKRQLIGVYAADLIDGFAEALRQLGSDHSWVAHGDGLDELTVTGISDVAILNNDLISRRRIDPQALGLGLWKKDDLQGGSPEENAAALEALLQGAPQSALGAYRDIAMLNAGAALIVGGKAETLEDGIALARAVIDSGAALDLVQRMRHHSL